MARPDTEKIFSRIYARNSWGNQESRSGPGSTVTRTDRLRPELSTLLRELQIQSVLDVPCGDFNWMRLTELPSIEYVGADIVPDVVRENNLRHAAAGRRFVQADMLAGPLPRADLVLCRDGLVHFSFFDLARALRVIKESASTYLLATTFAACKKNVDVATGDWRPLNLEVAPLSFPQPLRVLSDAPSNATFPDKSLALYRIQDLPDELAYNRIRAAWQRMFRRVFFMKRRP
jgi:SAM-dependent methyltransferase